MQLLEGETTITSASDVVLTTWRLIQEGEVQIVIPVENLDSALVHRVHYPWLIVVGLVIILAGLMVAGNVRNDGGPAAIAGLVIGGVLILCYFFGRSVHAVFRSSRATIDLVFPGRGFGSALAFVNQVQAAGMQRKRELAGPFALGAAAGQKG